MKKDYLFEVILFVIAFFDPTTHANCIEFSNSFAVKFA